MHPPEGGSGGGYDGAKRNKGSKVHAAVDAPGHLLLALHVTPADEQGTARGWKSRRGPRKKRPRSRWGSRRTWTGATPAGSVRPPKRRLAASAWEVVEHPEAKRGFVLLARRRVVGRDSARASRFRRSVEDYERPPASLAGLHFVAFACLFLQQATGILGAGP